MSNCLINVLYHKRTKRLFCGAEIQVSHLLHVFYQLFSSKSGVWNGFSSVSATYSLKVDCALN